MIRIFTIALSFIVACAALASAFVSAGAQADDYGAFGRARIAAANGNVGVAAQQYGIALTASPRDPTVANRAFRQAMAAGDLALARRAVAALGSDAPNDAKLLLLADAVKSGSPVTLDKALASLDKTPFDFFVPAVRAWHEELGARFVAEGRCWTVMHDPAGGIYCLTPRSPETGLAP